LLIGEAKQVKNGKRELFRHYKPIGVNKRNGGIMSFLFLSTKKMNNFKV
jgi:hypothetical protein